MAEQPSGPAIATRADDTPPRRLPLRPLFVDRDVDANAQMACADLILRADEVRLTGRSRGWALIAAAAAAWLLVLLAAWAGWQLLTGLLA